VFIIDHRTTTTTKKCKYTKTRIKVVFATSKTSKKKYVKIFKKYWYLSYDGKFKKNNIVVTIES